MVQLWNEGLELEEYVFFFIDLFAEGLEGRGPVRPWYRGDQDDYVAHQAFRVSSAPQDAVGPGSSIVHLDSCMLVEVIRALRLSVGRV